MKENDLNFINTVTDFYYETVDDEHPNGNMSAVADKFNITRAKVNKILITSGAIDSPLHQDVMRLKEEGYSVEEIANVLLVSTATVKINMPYEKVIYNGEVKSVDAHYMESYRKREQVFLDKVVRKPTDREVISKLYCELPISDIMPMDDYELEEDIIHLEARYTEEESKLFKINPDIALLHIELNDEVPEEYRELCGIKYDKSISRDIVLPMSIPLHNLHYAINQAFGFTNSHLHEYQLCEKDLKWITAGKAENWKKLIGLVFKNPMRDEDIDFWDDDYESGSPKKWMQSKYTGPNYAKIYEEGYRYISREVEDLEVSATNIDELHGYGKNPFAINETLGIQNILELNPEGKMSFDEYYEELNDCIIDASTYPDTTIQSQPWVPGFAEKLYYTYDFGDNWHFTITPKFDVEYLKDRVTEKDVKDTIKKVCTLARPVILAADGYPLVDDCNGLIGYIDTLKEIKEGDKESKRWIEGMGWKKKIDKNAL